MEWQGLRGFLPASQLSPSNYPRVDGGDKEKIASARGRIFNAIIGIILFAIAFAIIRVIGQFTGFTFFKGQNDVVIVSTGYDSTSQSSYVLCSNGRKLFTPRKDNAVCTE